MSRKAQEAILKPDMPDADKEEVVDEALETTLRIGQNRTTYNAITDAHNAKRDIYNANRRE